MNDLLLTKVLSDKALESTDNKNYKCKICGTKFVNEEGIVLSESYHKMMGHTRTHVAEMFDEFITAKAVKE